MYYKVHNLKIQKYKILYLIHTIKMLLTEKRDKIKVMIFI